MFEEANITDFRADAPRIRACLRQCRLSNSTGSCPCWKPEDCCFELPFDPKRFVTDVVFVGDQGVYFHHAKDEVDAAFGN